MKTVEVPLLCVLGACVPLELAGCAANSRKPTGYTNSEALAARPSSPKPEIRPVLVLLWDPHRDGVALANREHIERLIFGPAPSVRDYYSVQSGARVELQSAGVLGWFDADHPASHYWEHPVDANDGFAGGHTEKWTEAIRKADATIDFSAFDKDHDGTLSTRELGVCVLIPQNQAFGTVRGTAGRELPTFEPLVVDGVILPLVSEVYCAVDTGLGVFAHELGHLLFDLPDMYGAPLPAHSYSLMDASYNDALLDPCNKLHLGWMDVRDVFKSGTYALRDVQTSRQLLRIADPKDPRICFLIENRERGVYDSALPDAGLAVWRWTEDTSGDWGRTSIAMLRSAWPPDDAHALWSSVRPQELMLTSADGTSTGIVLRRFSAPGELMSLKIVMPPTSN